MKTTLATFLALFIFSSSAAFAAHPLNTDDAGTQGMLKFQVEATGEFSWDKDTDNGVTTKTNQQLLGLTVTAGLFDSLDASISFPYLLQQAKQNDVTVLDETGLADITLALKWRFLELGPVSLAIKPSMNIPNGDRDKGLGAGRSGYAATLISTIDLKPLTVHANLGYVHQDYVDADRGGYRSDFWKMSVAAGVAVTKSLQLVAEVGTATSTLQTSRVWPSFVTGGLIYSLNDKLDLDLGVRGGFNKPATDLTLLTGVTFRFP